jgi:transcriptional regulator with XRE-family HTH domain
MALPPAEVARRVRAAFAYAGEDISKQHPDLGISPSTVARIVSSTKPRGADSDELGRVAAFTKVPLSFLLEGWASEEASTSERLEALEHQYAALRSELQREAQELRDARTEFAANIRKLEQALGASTTKGRRQTGPGADG